MTWRSVEPANNLDPESAGYEYDLRGDFFHFYQKFLIILQTG